MLAENYKIVPIGSDIDLNGAAANDTDSINMKNYHRATLLINLQTLGVADSYLAVYSGATAGTKTSALTFRYAFGGAAQGSADCDVLDDWATSAMLTIANATHDNHMLVVEVDATDMDLANGEFWLTASFLDTDTGATGNVSVIAVLEPRYKSNQSATAIA